MPEGGQGTRHGENSLLVEGMASAGLESMFVALKDESGWQWKAWEGD